MREGNDSEIFEKGLELEGEVYLKREGLSGTTRGMEMASSSWLPIEDNDSIRCRQIDTHTARTRGEEKDEGGGVLVEAIDGLLAVVA